MGIIGAGMIVNTLFDFIHEISGITIHGVCARKGSEEKLERICREQGIPCWYTDVDEMLEKGDIDTVYVAVPNHLHYEYTKKALHAGKHVICEKPFTSNLREMEELIDLARARNLVMVEAVSTLYIPNALKIRETLPKLGNIRIVSMNYSQYSSRYNAFKEGTVLPAFNPAMSGGALMDLNIYNINFAVLLFGKPLTVRYQANVQKGIDTSGILTLEYPDYQCVCIGAKDCRAPLMTSIQGDEGCILTASSPNVLADYRVLLNSEKGEGRLCNENGGRHRMYHEFVVFEKMIRELDFETSRNMQEISRITIEIQTKARQDAGVVFPADLA